MARKFDLRKYQEEILARIGKQAEVAGLTSRSRLGVGIGKARVLVNLDEISEVVPLPELTAVPLTRLWFLGVANVRGVLYSIIDLALLGGDEEDGAVPTQLKDNSRVLLFHEQFRQQAGIVVDRVVGLRNMGQMQAKTPAAPPPFWARETVYEDESGAVWLELDVEALITSKQFTQPGLG